MLNVSRASLREALSVMEIMGTIVYIKRYGDMGIVDIRPGEGSLCRILMFSRF